MLSLGEIQRVLQALLREGVSVRDLGAIVEAVGDKARLTRDPSMLAEYARQALGRTIVAPYLDLEGTLRAIALDPALEQEIAEALVQTADGEFLAMDPTRAGTLVDACAEQVEHALGARRPARCCSARRACAGTCGGCASSGCRSSRSAPTTRSRPGVAVETTGVIGPADAMAGGGGVECLTRPR